ncbi:hypothetical protein E1295_30665 [Nonomuraea mesophila]|uniref:Right-handed parallel beta-helix repeat-containing protein n=1 Tax=Nonomuraea mesophila TaxID=2530382 RepID=A0A4R5F1F6_9ACTN|nr:hypothetical protein [Nonomuraea mesophila]TDE41348.1 hypothetical protein E1295_30665 [Nonomuraea mesophila]
MRGPLPLLAAVAVLATACQATPAEPPPPPSPSPEPSITRADGSFCPDHPTPACTGAPRGTKLTKVRLETENVAHRVREPGTVLDGVHVPGHLLIHADDVTVRNSVIDGDVINSDGPESFRFTITDTTVGTTGKCEPLPGVGHDKYKATRVLVQGHSDGFRVSGDDVEIRDSFVKLCSNPGDHSDGIQAYNGGKGLLFHHNTVDQREARHITAPIFLVDEKSQDVVVTDNLIMGGTFSLQVRNARGRQVVRGNKLVDKSWVYGPVDSECGRTEWSGNELVTIDESYRVTSIVGPLECEGES